MRSNSFPLEAGDALLVVDVQNDFCPGGAIPVPHGDDVVPEINRWLRLAIQQNIPVFVSRDWHPKSHISFKDRGGPWRPHCIQGTPGAAFHTDLNLPSTAMVISKATLADEESYSAFNETELANLLRATGAERLWIAGLALDYCVKETAIAARRLGYEVHLIANATRPVNVHPDDGKRALKELSDMGVIIESERSKDLEAA